MKTLTSQKRRALLTARKLLQDKAIAIENDLRGLLRNFGLKVGVVGSAKFEARIRELVEGTLDLVEIVEPLLDARRPYPLFSIPPSAVLCTDLKHFGAGLL